jgi:DNA polymerase elongation subunit (family B)
MLDYNFYQHIEDKHNYVKYSDTDSLYINIPQENEVDINKKIKVANNVSKYINLNITKYMNEYMLPKCGIDPKYNYTDFKTEFILSAMIFLEVKKNYILQQEVKEGKIFEPPKIGYTGIGVTKSDLAKFTQDYIKYIIEEILLKHNSIPKDILNQINTYSIQQHQLVKEYLENFNCLYIGKPAKWGGKEYERFPTSVIGMKLYNTMTNSITFTPISAGLRIPIKILNEKIFSNLININKNNHKYFLNDITPDKITNITFPYSYDSQTLKEQFNKFKIAFDLDGLWNVIYSTTCQRIVGIIQKISQQSSY